MNLTDIRVKLIVIFSVLCVSFSAILVRFATAPSMVLVFYRMLFAAILMTVPGIPLIRKEWPNITKKDLFCCVISGIFLAFHFTTYFEALNYTSISSTLVLVDTEVFFVSFILLFFFHEKLTRTMWIGIAITFIGSVIIAMGDASGTQGSLLGDLLALTGAFCVSIYTIMGKLCRKHMSTSSYTMIVYWVATVVMVILIPARGDSLWGYGLRNVLCGVGMTILCTLLGHNIFSWGLKYVSASFITTAKLIEPVFASLLGILFFMEIPTMTAITGGCLIIAGVYLASKGS